MELFTNILFGFRLIFTYLVKKEFFELKREIMCNEYTWLWYLLSYAIACFGAHFIVKLAVNKLWDLTLNDFQKKGIQIPDKPINPNATVSFWYGVTERTICWLCFILCLPEGIAVWLTFKAVVRWKMSEEPDPRHIPGSLIYMIGTAMNIIIGFLGALIAFRDFSFIIP